MAHARCMFRCWGFLAVLSMALVGCQAAEMLVRSQNDFWAALINSDVTVMRLLSNVALSNATPFAGTAGPFVLNRSISIIAANGSTYVALDFNSLNAGSVTIGAGITVSLQHLRLEDRRFVWLGYNIALFTTNSTGRLQMTDCLVHVSTCPSPTTAAAALASFPRLGDVPGKQTSRSLPRNVCYNTGSFGGGGGGPRGPGGGGGGPGGPGGGGPGDGHGGGGGPDGGGGGNIGRRLLWSGIGGSSSRGTVGAASAGAGRASTWKPLHTGLSRGLLQVSSPPPAPPAVQNYTGPSGSCWLFSFQLLDAALNVSAFQQDGRVYEAVIVDNKILCNEMSMTGMPAPDAPPAPPEPAAAPQDAGVSAAVIGGAVGGAVGFVLLVAAIAAFFLWRRRQQASAWGSDPDDQVKGEAAPGSKAFVQIEFVAPQSEQAPTSSSGTPGISSIDTGMVDSAEKMPVLVTSCKAALHADDQNLDVVLELNEMSRSIEASIPDNQLVIQTVIGAGAFGTVYRGTWQGLTVAVKSLVFSNDTMGADSNEKKRRMLMEAALSKSIAHPHVVATYSYDLKLVPVEKDLVTGSSGLSVRTEGNVLNYWRLFIIQELCDGGSLLATIQNKTLASAAVNPATSDSTMAQVLQLAIGLASGMAHLHDRNVVHGDLNPANVLLKSSDDSGRMVPKVCDFGFSILLTDNKSHVSNARRGTPFYIAPEVLKQGSLSRAADVYAMGVMLWELYMGTLVYKMDGQGHAVLRSTFPRLQAPPWYARLVSQCLSKLPSQRPTFVMVLEALLKAHDKLQAQGNATAGVPPAKVDDVDNRVPSSTAPPPATQEGAATPHAPSPPTPPSPTHVGQPKAESVIITGEASELAPGVERWLNVRSA